MRLIHWCTLVCGCSAAGAVFGWCIGKLLAALSGDYVVVASDYVWRGLRVGLFAGTAVAAWHAITQQPSWGAIALWRAGSIASLVTISALGLIVSLALLLSLVIGVMSEDANLAHPRRYAVFLAIHQVWPYAAIFGIIVGCFALRRQRV